MVQNITGSTVGQNFGWAAGADGVFYTVTGGESWSSFDALDFGTHKSLFANNEFLASVLFVHSSGNCDLRFCSNVGDIQIISLQYPDTLGQFVSSDSKYWHFQTGEEILGLVHPICIASQYAIGTWVQSENNPNYFVLNSYLGNLFITDMASSDAFPGVIVAVGGGGLILKSEDSGITWDDISIDNTNEHFTNVAFASPGYYYLTTYSGWVYTVDNMGNVLNIDEGGPDNGGPLSVNQSGSYFWSGTDSWANTGALDWRRAGSNYFNFFGFYDMEIVDFDVIGVNTNEGIFKQRTSTAGIPCGDRNFSGFIEENLGEKAGDANNNGSIDSWIDIDDNYIWFEFAGDVNCNNIRDPGEFYGDINGDGIINGNEIMGDIDGDYLIYFPFGELAGDVNGNGVIDDTELAGDINGDGYINDDELSGDSNGDGVINFNELAGDNNGDGYIDGYELLVSMPRVRCNDSNSHFNF
jgi:hypothetical protein